MIQRTRERSAGQEHGSAEERVRLDRASHAQAVTGSSGGTICGSKFRGGDAAWRGCNRRETARMRWAGPWDVRRRRIETPPCWTEWSEPIAGYGWPSIEYRNTIDRTVARRIEWRRFWTQSEHLLDGIPPLLDRCGRVPGGIPRLLDRCGPVPDRFPPLRDGCGRLPHRIP